MTMTACFGSIRFAMLGRNQAVVLAPDLVACDGLIHIVDSVLITPALTTLRQLTLRPELSLFTQIVTAPGNELLVDYVSFHSRQCMGDWTDGRVLLLTGWRFGRRRVSRDYRASGQRRRDLRPDERRRGGNPGVPWVYPRGRAGPLHRSVHRVSDSAAAGAVSPRAGDVFICVFVWAT